jgi:hypothetical protein
MTATERSHRFRAKQRADKPRNETATKSGGADTGPLRARIRELESENARLREHPPTKPVEDEPASLPKSYRERFEAMCRRQEREYAARVQFQVQQEIGRRIDEMVLPAWRQRLENAQRQYESINRILDRRAPLIPKALFLKLWAYANPGTRDQVSEAEHRRLWDALNANKGNRKLIELALCGKEAERPTTPPPTWAEMMTAREKVRAENSARAKRAAATRAARNQGKE